jgi:hypothetical protein
MDEATCGKGLAEHAALPAKLAELVAALAENLELHQKTLDLSDESSRKEHDAYVKLAQEYRSIAMQLKTTAARMASYRDLPMGRHDERMMAAPEIRDAFARFVRLERELLILVQSAVARDQEMVTAMEGASPQIILDS